MKPDRIGAVPGDLTRRQVLRGASGAGIATVALALAGGGGLATGPSGGTPGGGTPLAGEANLFDLAAPGTTITYATSGLDGRPRFTYRSGEEDVHAVGDEIAVAESALGRLVTVLVAATPDLWTRTVTLVVPTVHPTGNPTPVDTLAILTTARTTVAGPGAVQGQVQTYRVLSLIGMARSVLF